LHQRDGRVGLPFRDDVEVRGEIAIPSIVGQARPALARAERDADDSVARFHLVDAKRMRAAGSCTRHVVRSPPTPTIARACTRARLAGGVPQAAALLMPR